MPTPVAETSCHKIYKLEDVELRIPHDIRGEVHIVITDPITGGAYHGKGATTGEAFQAVCNIWADQDGEPGAS